MVCEGFSNSLRVLIPFQTYNAVGEGKEDCKYEDSEEGCPSHAPDGGWNLKEFVAEKRCHVRQSDRQQPEEES